MHPEIHLTLHHMRAAELHVEARHRATPAQPRQDIRARLGWTLVEVGLRLATPRPALTASS
jgi:hypothetical protein